ncbi:MAG: putative transaldolase [Berkelbacteria bacterium GW2011_GWA1_36_9]|uniref:Putative transaldolase n=1 Tax=Berkelbacteria bacterium GW2011_GWA1_36_9 TaxID=1618331 RepID=A0A0G0FWG9_9BACT|nr:MAG: putative transaldolase [Berkelbacteria bacterium GW2011_GWA1_36_9]
MKIFVDSSNIDEIKMAISWHLADGVTTNPSTLGKTGQDPYKVVRQICSLVKGPVSMEVTVKSHKDIVEEGRKISEISKNILVKVPVTRDGLLAIYDLAKSGIKVNATNLFTPVQALIAARNGASYVSTWMGRSDDIYMDAVKLVKDTKEIFDVYNIKTQIIAASIKNTRQIVSIAKTGVDIATIPFDVIEKMTTHPMTDTTFDGFLNDWYLNPTLKRNPKK